MYPWISVIKCLCLVYERVDGGHFCGVATDVCLLVIITIINMEEKGGSLMQLLMVFKG